ncbi:hypothetical protein BESB_070750 [Besnoitia besnoiti]|uniref:Histone RNA hairpin-binding protein RNA-binding domain-containing protein n=1 Tax=Besnoitia besnoiti TaxID=94643 RepID=A0A2A9ME26_BESBE|nr:uncharacterized protein BESB_070750 [Besnoitia besnoiti]PFH33923.1 hypothetical protein BESB_070750 [Besnoitia besnoiti]
MSERVRLRCHCAVAEGARLSPQEVLELAAVDAYALRVSRVLVFWLSYLCVRSRLSPSTPRKLLVGALPCDKMTFLGGVRWADLSSDTQSLSALPSTPKCAGGGMSVASSAAAAALLLQNEAADHSYLNPSSCAAEFENSSAGLNLHFRNAAILGGPDAVLDVPCAAASSGDCEAACLPHWTEAGKKGAAGAAGCAPGASTTPGFKGLLGSSSSSSHAHDAAAGEGVRGGASAASAAAATSLGDRSASGAASKRTSDRHLPAVASSALAAAGVGSKTAGGKARPTTPSAAAGGAAVGDGTRGVHGSKAAATHARAPASSEDAEVSSWRQVSRRFGPREPAAARAPALTPAKRNRRTSGGGCRGSSVTLLGRRDLDEEADEEAKAAGSEEGAPSGGMAHAQQPPSKKKRSLHPSQTHARGAGGDGQPDDDRDMRSEAVAPFKGSERAFSGLSSKRGSASTAIPGFVSHMFIPTLASSAGGAAVTPATLGLSLLPHPNAKAGGEAEDDEDEWARRESARMKDIAIGKATQGYRNFIRAVPKDERGDGDPATPDPKQRCSKAQFQREYQDWRKQLHRYDSCSVRGMSPAEPAAGEAERAAAARQTGGRDAAEEGAMSEAKAGEAPENGEEIAEEFADETDPILEFNRECELAGL